MNVPTGSDGRHISRADTELIAKIIAPENSKFFGAVCKEPVVTMNHAVETPRHLVPGLKGRRPRTLAQVVECEREFGQLDAFLREFCDEFYIEQDAAKRAAMLEVEPPLIDDEREDAYLAAAAEHLAQRYHLPVPHWTNQPVRFLHRAWFPCGLESLKAMLLRDSPTAFRRRMIFVDRDPLYRPRRDKPSFG
jgi:hypothetical protein